MENDNKNEISQDDAERERSGVSDLPMLQSNRLAPSSSHWVATKNRKYISTLTQSADTPSQREYDKWRRFWTERTSKTNPGCRQGKRLRDSAPWKERQKRCTALSSARPSRTKISSGFRHGRATSVFLLSFRSQLAETSEKSKSINHSRSGLKTHWCEPTCCSKPVCSRAWTRSRHLAKALFLADAPHLAHFSAWPIGSRDRPTSLAGVGGETVVRQVSSHKV